ncbi:MAG: hypothetical protein ACOY0T_09995 [Myxococcota bacterium]
MTCPSGDTAVAWLLSELSEADADVFEEHYFACDACFERTRELARIVEVLQASLPTILTEARRLELERRVPTLRTVHVQPDERALLRLGDAVPVGVWVLHANLADVDRLNFTAYDAQGVPQFSIADVPFDRKRGEVALACQVHYRNLGQGKELHAELTRDDAGVLRCVARYVLDHDFESSHESL